MLSRKKESSYWAYGFFSIDLVFSLLTQNWIHAIAAGALLVIVIGYFMESRRAKQVFVH